MLLLFDVLVFARCDTNGSAMLKPRQRSGKVMIPSSTLPQLIGRVTLSLHSKFHSCFAGVINIILKRQIGDDKQGY